MNGMCLTLYTHELTKHHGILLYEWILEWAKKQKVPGGSAFRSIAGYGKHGILHEEHFYELPANACIAVKFFLKQEDVQRFLQMFKDEKISVFYSLSQVEFGNT